MMLKGFGLLGLAMVAVPALSGFMLVSDARGAEADTKYACVSVEDKATSTLTLLPVEGLSGMYLDPLNRDRWKLDRPGSVPQLISVRYLRSGIDKPMVATGPAQLECATKTHKMTIFPNLAENVCASCSGPGNNIQYQVLSRTDLEAPRK